MNPKFLDESGVLQIHSDLIERFGGSHGLRDRGMLLSAIEMPKASFGGQFLHEDLFEMAAAYLYHLVQNHAFIDGNKRIGTAAALVFLDVNGFELTAEQDDLTEMVLEVAQGRLGKPEIADFLRRHARPNR
jgi:death on curing protein